MRIHPLARCVTHDSTTELRNLHDDLFERQCDAALMREIWPDSWPEVDASPCVWGTHMRTSIDGGAA